MRLALVTRGWQQGRLVRRRRGKLTQVTIGLPAELVAELDQVAAAELRSRGRLVEMLIRGGIAAPADCSESRLVASYKKTIADAKAKIAKAEATAFMVRLEAIDAILEGASPGDVMLLAATALTNAAPYCCDKHLDEFKEEFLRMLDSCVAVAREREEQNDAEAEAQVEEADDGDAPRQLH
jgi:hypothetical protein